MALLAFKEQVDKYKTEEVSDFRRMNLVYAFQDILNEIKPRSRIEPGVLESVENLLELQKGDSGLMQTIGFDLLEPSIKLNILSGVPTPKQVHDLNYAIALNSNAKELLIQLNAIMSYFKLEGEDQPIDVFTDITADGKSMLKSVVTFYLSRILEKIEEKYLKTTIQELYIYIELLENDLESSCEVLGTELIIQLLNFIENRSLQIKINAETESCKFLFDLLGLYQRLNRFHAEKLKVISVITLLFGDLPRILQNFATKLDLDIISSGILAIAREICDPSSPITLPSVLSPAFRLQTLLLPCIKASSSFPSEFLHILTHTISSLPSEIPLSRLRSLYKKSSSEATFIEILELCGGGIANPIKVSMLSQVKSLYHKIEAHARLRFLRGVIKECTWDMAKANLVDWVCEDIVNGSLSVAEGHEFVDNVVDEKFNLENIETLQACLRISRLVKEKCEGPRYVSLKKKYQVIFEELHKTNDAKIPKLGLVLMDLTEILQE